MEKSKESKDTKLFSKTELEVLLEESLIDSSLSINEPEICLQIEANDQISTIGTFGNFSLIKGKAKSRKTYLISILLSAAIKKGFILDQIKCSLKNNKNTILYFDTEQSKYHVQRTLRNICCLSGNKYPKKLKVFSLRKYSPKERLEIIEYAIYKYQNIGLIAIDGIRDLITSINDEEQSTIISSKLLKWTEELNTHIVVVLHENKGDSNARGHIGTELVNKTETVMTVTKFNKPKSYSLVNFDYCRDIEPQPFAFEIDENGVPKLFKDWQSSSTTKNKKQDINSIDNSKLYNITLEIFKHKKEVSYSELALLIKNEFLNSFNQDIGINKAKDILKLIKNSPNWIIQKNQKGKYSLGSPQVV